MGNLFTKWRGGLERTRKAAFGRLSTIFGTSDITAETWEGLEAILVQADMGIETAQSIINKLQQQTAKKGITQASSLQEVLRNDLLSRLEQPPKLNLDQFNPAVILLVGVNGSGKTTTAAKLGKIFADDHKKVLLVAADTYRAAAVEQLQIWGERLNIQVITSQPEADPGSVAYDAIQAAIARKFDRVIIDTAGRLHTRYNLMEEIKKVYRVTGKALVGAPHATWLVLDATTGQNALHQARAFKDAVNITGIILAKLDSSARGGMAFAIQHELGLPILYAGIGEKPDDLQVFNLENFVDGVLTTQ
jgi:fused signal recognition particle receptor